VQCRQESNCWQYDTPLIILRRCKVQKCYFYHTALLDNQCVPSAAESNSADVTTFAAVLGYRQACVLFAYGNQHNNSICFSATINSVKNVSLYGLDGMRQHGETIGTRN